MNFYNYSEMITIQLTGFLNLKPVNWNFVKNQLTVQLSNFSTQPYPYPKVHDKKLILKTCDHVKYPIIIKTNILVKCIIECTPLAYSLYSCDNYKSTG